MRTFLLFLCSVSLLVSGCVTSPKVERFKAGDNEMNCTQIQVQIDEANRFKDAAEKNKGATGSNVAATLFFWPALLANYSDANEAIRAAEDRKAVLVQLYNEKGCGRSDNTKVKTEPCRLGFGCLRR